MTPADVHPHPDRYDAADEDPSPQQLKDIHMAKLALLPPSKREAAYNALMQKLQQEPNP